MSTFPWKKVPFSRLIIPFIAAIIVAFLLPDFEVWWGIIPLTLLLFCIAFEKLSVIRLFRWRNYHAFSISLAILLSTICLYKMYVPINKQYHFSKHYNKESIILAKLTEVPENKEKTLKCVLNVKAIIQDGTMTPYKGKILAYFQKSPNAEKLFYGDMILLKTKITEVSPPLNPAQFDFKEFLSYKRIYHQAFLKDNNWVNTKENNTFFIVYKIIQLRQQIIHEIKKSIKNTDDQTIAMALLVGYQSELSNEVKLSFISTGAMHVLSVSGLHVGLIYFVFSFLTKFLKKRKFGKFIFLATNLCFLWTYALLTGFSPSVLRATTMFTFVLLGQNLGRIPNIYSSLYFSLFILLLFNPLMISQVGFQLSYVAVIGIVALQPRIYNLLNLKKIWILDKIWALTAVSLAAQLATFPLGLFYFTQFPVYFLVSNLLVIPISTFILYCGFVWLISIPIGIEYLEKILSFVLDTSVSFLHQSVMVVQNFPKGIIGEVYISLVMTLLLYLFVAFLIVFMIQKQKKYLLILTTISLLLCSGYLIWNIKNQLETKAIIYSIRNQTLIGFYNQGDVTFWGDSSILNDYDNLKYNTFRDVWKYGQKARNIKKIPFGQKYNDHNISISANYCNFNNNVFTYIKKIPYQNYSSTKFKTDYLIISPQTGVNVNKLLSHFKTEHFIVNTFSKSRKIIKVKDYALKEGFSYTNLSEKGSVQIKFNSKIDFRKSIQYLSLRIREIRTFK